MPPATDPPVPVAGRYELLRALGMGGSGSVWLCRDRRDGALVAAKLLGRRRDGDAEGLLRFVREQQVRIRHPHVLAPTGWAAEDERVLLVMDLVRGGSLAQLLEEHGPLPAAYVAMLLDQLLQALAAVHAAGVVHRDVKPANLLLEATSRGVPHLRLADFGVAVVLGDPRLTSSAGPVGTPGYLPPEALAGAPPAPAQDVWAAAVVATRALGGDPRRPEDLGAGPLGPVLLAMLAEDPDARPDALGALIAVRAAAPFAEQAGLSAPCVPDRVGAMREPHGRRASTTRLAAACLAASAALSGLAALLVTGRL